MHGTQERIDTKRLNVPRVKLLIEALRSGDYKQGTGQLKESKHEDSPVDLFCCLGVGCDVYRTGAKKGKWDGDDFLHPDDLDEPSCNLPPEAVMRWFGFYEMDGDISVDPVLAPRGEVHTTAIEMNDEGNSSFASIAKKFEKLINA